jgi:hypothetical protein
MSHVALVKGIVWSCKQNGLKVESWSIAYCEAELSVDAVGMKKVGGCGSQGYKSRSLAQRDITGYKH